MDIIPRGPNPRIVKCDPTHYVFKPRGIPTKDLPGEVAVTIEELEAVRLTDLEGLKQREAAEMMNISQSTISRHLESAHRKIAKALLYGLSIKIENPLDYYHCEKCGHFWPVKENTDLDVIEASLLADISVNLPNDLIVKMDIACMANFLEARSPFLDRQLVEFVASLPMEIKMKNFRLKYLLKSAVNNIVPHQNLYRPKKGFAVPLGHWFRKDLKTFLFDTLLNNSARIGKIFNMKYVRELIKQHVEGRRDYSHHLWLLLMLELWFLEFEE